MISERMKQVISVLENSDNGFADVNFNNIDLQALQDEFNGLNAFVNSIAFLNEWQKIFNRLTRIIDSQKLKTA